ncbi:MAG: hypothetical protein AAGJ93_16500 [Bacteroidota bacterium]
MAKKFAIPAANNSLLRKLTQPFYQKYLQAMARTYFMVYHYLEKNADLRDRVQAEYLHFVESGQVGAGSAFHPNSGGFFLQEKLRGYSDEHQKILEEKLGALAVYNWDVAAGFWLRRRIDTTAVAFFELITELLKTYDQEWLMSPPELPEK